MAGPMGVAWRRVFATEPLWDILVCSIWKGPSGGFRVGDTHDPHTISARILEILQGTFPMVW